MEMVMVEDDEYSGCTGYDRSLSPEQWQRLKQRVSRRAHAARAQAVRDLLREILLAVRKLAQGGQVLARTLAARGFALAGRWGQAYALWLERRQAIRELGALDDRALKDFGISRSEIESLVYGRDSPRVSERRIAATLFHMPYDRSCAKKPATKQLIQRSAA
jgi:uncharacterized protein YjiS (DUF1127 family)